MRILTVMGAVYNGLEGVRLQRHQHPTELRVLGKGKKQRLMPLPPEAIQAIQKYLRLERPLTSSPALFVSLACAFGKAA